MACGIFAVLIVYQGLMVLINTEIKVARNVSILQMTGALLLVALTAAVFPLGLDFRSKRADAKDGALDSERQAHLVNASRWCTAPCEDQIVG